MTANIDLVCVEGPLVGERIQLNPATSLLIGRSKRGVHLPDPLVSIEHAEISWTTDRYFIVDLGSLSGTFLDERRLSREPTPILPGMTLQVGESTFKVEVRRVRAAWFWPLAGFLVFMLVVMGTILVAAVQPVLYEPSMGWGVPIRQGAVAEPVVRIPLSFVRRYGLDHRDLVIRRVTDYDRNEVDELWMDTPVDHIVVTFAEGAAGPEWKLLGRFPKGCYDRPALDFPDERCGGELYFYEKGQYILAAHDGIVGWIYPPPPVPSGGEAPPPSPAAPTPFRFTLVEREKLAGFLLARGVTDRIHYIVCEEALPGLKAQVLTQSGKLEPLDFGCLGDLALSGAAELSDRPPRMIAFTASGRRALVDDMTTWLSGGPDGLFLDGHGGAVMGLVAAEPASRVMMRLSFIGVDLAIDPIADDRPLVGVRRLIPSGTVLGLPAPAATTIVLDGAGALRADPPGCSELLVESAGWICAWSLLCTPGADFVAVREVGCGLPEPQTVMIAPYSAFLSGGGNGNVDVRVALDTHVGARRLDVLRSRVSWRILPPPPIEEAPPAP